MPQTSESSEKFIYPEYYSWENSGNCEGNPTKTIPVETSCILNDGDDALSYETYYSVQLYSPNTTSSSESNNTLSSGAVAAISIGGFIFICIICGVSYYFYWKKKISLLNSAPDIELAANRSSSTSTSVSEKSTVEKLQSFMVFFANLCFRHSIPLGKRIKLRKNEALLFMILLLILPCLTFSMMMYYFLYAGCQPISLSFPGISGQASITQTILSSSVYWVCVTRGVNPTGDTFCCIVEGVHYQGSKSICQNVFDNCLTAADSCYPVETGTEVFSEIDASIIQCSSISTAFTNSLQYGIYVSIIICVGFFIGKFISAKSFSNICSPHAWKDFIEKSSE